MESLENHVRAGCSATRGAFCRAVTRAVFVRLYRPWSREAIRRIFRYCFHLVNSCEVRMSPGATLVLYFQSRRPSPRCNDYSSSAERVQANTKRASITNVNPRTVQSIIARIIKPRWVFARGGIGIPIHFMARSIFLLRRSCFRAAAIESCTYQRQSQRANLIATTSVILLAHQTAVWAVAVALAP
jgi:hypothetical protein